jgi:hypothetical protein
MKQNDENLCKDKSVVKQVAPFVPEPGTFPEMLVSPAFFEPMTPEELAEWEGK